MPTLIVSIKCQYSRVFLTNSNELLHLIIPSQIMIIYILDRDYKSVLDSSNARKFGQIKLFQPTGLAKKMFI